MSKSKDTQSGNESDTSAEAQKGPTAVGEQGSDRRSGRVAYDSRGNPIWEWQLETGVYTRDVNTQKLKKLDLGELSLADTVIQKKPDLTAPAQQPGGGFNPYDRGVGGGFNPYDNARSPRSRGNEKPSAAPARKPTDMRKLDEWIKLKKSVQDKKDE